MIRALFFWLMMAGAAFAVQPDEVLESSALEARARVISKGLRCLVCRNESIDESNAELARDLRVMVRERLVVGDTDSQVLEFVVARYGEYVLLKPLKSGSTILLWIAGPALLAGGVLGAGIYIRRSSIATSPDELSDGEKTRLAELFDK